MNDNVQPVKPNDPLYTQAIDRHFNNYEKEWVEWRPIILGCLEWSYQFNDKHHRILCAIADLTAGAKDPEYQEIHDIIDTFAPPESEHDKAKKELGLHYEPLLCDYLQQQGLLIVSPPDPVFYGVVNQACTLGFEIPEYIEEMQLEQTVDAVGAERPTVPINAIQPDGQKYG